MADQKTTKPAAKPAAKKKAKPKADDTKLIESIAGVNSLEALKAVLGDTEPAGRSKAVNHAVYQATQRIVGLTVPLP